MKRKWINSTNTKTYFAWRSMRSRCHNKNNPSYPHYGGRGIIVCAAWNLSYDQFVADMGEVPDGLTLERIDTNGNYTPENCRWATIKEQLNNQRRNRRLTLNGRTQTAAQWAEELGIRADTLHKRLERMDASLALKAGKLKEWRHGTRQGYEAHKCRCDLCREANNRRMRERRIRLAQNEARQ